MVQKIINPNFNIKTFNIKYKDKLSPISQTIIQSFKIDNFLVRCEL